MFYNRTIISTKETNPTDPKHDATSSQTRIIELQLPGMSDFRIIKTKKTNLPFSLSIKTKPSSTNPQEYSQLWFSKALGFGMFQNTPTGRQNLLNAEFTPNRKQLSVTIDWEKDNIVEYIVKI